SQNQFPAYVLYLCMRGFHFSKFDPGQQGQSPFDRLLNIFTQLLIYTSGDAGEALQWLNELDKEHQFTGDAYGIGDFIEDLKEKGYLSEDHEKGTIKITPKTERTIRKRSLEEIFGKLKKTNRGDHKTYKPGQGDEINPE